MISAPHNAAFSLPGPHADPALEAYVDAILTALPDAATTPLALAVSGGADSMALLHLTQRWAAGHGIALTALTVDHGLRPEAAAEAQQVQRWCTALGVPHHTLTPPALAVQSNIQHAARRLRYDALTGWCCTHHVPHLLLAHHADDQAETVTLQQHRGSTPPSRAGMALVTPREGVRLLRPLLGVRKARLIAYLQSLGQAWIDDPSNLSDRFARNRLRRTLNDNAVMALWHEAQQQGAARHADDAARRDWVLAHARMDGDHALQWPLTAWRTLPDARRTDVLSRAMQAVGQRPYRPRQHETARLDAQLRQEDTGTATLGHCLLRWQAGSALQLMPEPGRARPLDMGGTPPHILPTNPLKQLASEPFWWFNYPPL